MNNRKVQLPWENVWLQRTSLGLSVKQTLIQTASSLKQVRLSQGGQSTFGDFFFMINLMLASDNFNFKIPNSLFFKCVLYFPDLIHLSAYDAHLPLTSSLPMEVTSRQTSNNTPFQESSQPMCFVLFCIPLALNIHPLSSLQLTLGIFISQKSTVNSLFKIDFVLEQFQVYTKTSEYNSTCPPTRFTPFFTSQVSVIHSLADDNTNTLTSTVSLDSLCGILWDKYTTACVPHHCVQNSFTTLKNCCALPSHSSFPTPPRSPYP